MNSFVEIYKKNQDSVESFIINTLRDYTLEYKDDLNYDEHFKAFQSLELIYITDSNYTQISPNIFRKSINDKEMSKDRRYLIEKLIEKEDNILISKPYLSIATGNVCITVAKKDNDKYIFMDFSLDKLLGRLGLIELHPDFNRFTRGFYQTIGFSLIFFTALSILYAFYDFILYLYKDGFTINTLFKPIISITLGLAIFDLAKTILEREVFFKSYGESNEDAVILTKFSIAIIVALSIEALMVVFKITLHDYTQMIHALYLIIGVGIIIVSLGLFRFLTHKR